MSAMHTDTEGGREMRSDIALYPHPTLSRLGGGSHGWPWLVTIDRKSIQVLTSARGAVTLVVPDVGTVRFRYGGLRVDDYYAFVEEPVA